MKSSNNFFSSNNYYFINKKLLVYLGIEVSLLFSELIEQEDKNEENYIEENYIFNDLDIISKNTKLSKTKIKEGINKLYKLKFIDVIIKKPEKMFVKILYNNVNNFFLVTETNSFNKKNKKKNKLLKTKKFKKPSIKDLKDYFLKLGEVDGSEIMYDFYESKGWKVGKNSMKCWKSASRNWVRRVKKEKIKLPNFYDKDFEKEIINNKEKLFAYHKHLKNLGFKPSYSPTAGTTWKLIK
jgi:hypothetical protein